MLFVASVCCAINDHGAEGDVRRRNVWPPRFRFNSPSEGVGNDAQGSGYLAVRIVRSPLGAGATRAGERCGPALRVQTGFPERGLGFLKGSGQPRTSQAGSGHADAIGRSSWGFRLSARNLSSVMAMCISFGRSRRPWQAMCMTWSPERHRKRDRVPPAQWPSPIGKSLLCFVPAVTGVALTCFTEHLRRAVRTH